MISSIEWTPEAEKTFDEILNYLEIEFGSHSVSKFISRVQTLLMEISEFPELFQAAKNSNVRKGFVSRQTSLYYRISGNRIELLSFWNNKKNPENLSL